MPDSLYLLCMLLPSVVWLLGAIPIVTADVLRDPLLYSSLYDRLPIVAVDERAASSSSAAASAAASGSGSGGWGDLTPDLLGKIYQHFRTAAAAVGKSATQSVFEDRVGLPAAGIPIIPGSIILPRMMNTLSVSRLYFPYWLHQYTEDLISGKPPARFFRDVPNSLRKTPPKCLPASPIDSSNEISNGKHRHLLDGQPKANLLKIKHTQQKVGKAMRKRAFKKAKQDLETIPSDGNGGFGNGVAVTNSTATTVLKPVLSASKSQASHNKSMPPFTLEIVIPRCCEDGLVCIICCVDVVTLSCGFLTAPSHMSVCTLYPVQKCNAMGIHRLQIINCFIGFDFVILIGDCMVSTAAPPYIACETRRYVQVSSVFTSLSWLAVDQKYHRT